MNPQDDRQTKRRGDVPDKTTGSPILVTGASGHLGANLVRRLLADHRRVRVMLKPGDDHAAVDGLDVERVYADLRDNKATHEAVAGCGAIYHCAAQVSTINGDVRLRRDIFETNVIGTRHLLEAARAAKAGRIVVTGSFSAVGYDLDDPSAASDETMPFYPMERTMPYERSKALVEHECLAAVARGQDVVIATCCAIVGGNDFLPSRLGRTLCDFVNGRLRAYIRGGFEFVAASDIVQGHLLCMEKGRSGHKYIFSTEFLMLDQLLDVFEDVSGVSAPRRVMPARVMLLFSELASVYLSRFHPDFPQRLTPGAIRLLLKCRHANATKARTELGYQPTTIRQAVGDAYHFHCQRGMIINNNG